MSLKEGIGFSQGFKVFNREISAVCESRVKAGSGVALGKHHAVSVLPFGIFGVDVHFLKVKIGKHIGYGKGSARMAGFSIIHPFDYAHSDFCCRDLKPFLFVFVQSLYTPY